MRKLLLMTVLIVVGSGTALSQLQEVKLEVAQANEIPVMRITNLADAPVEALLLVDDALGPAGDWHRTYFDIHMWPGGDRDKRISVGETRDVPLMTRNGSLPQIRLLAAIFSDGTTDGNESAVKELLKRRTIAMRQLRQIQRILQIAIENKIPSISTKTRLLDSWQDKRKKAPSEESERWEELALAEKIQNWAVGFLDSRTDPSNSSRPSSQIVVQKLATYVDHWIADLQSAKPTASGETNKP